MGSMAHSLFNGSHAGGYDGRTCTPLSCDVGTLILFLPPKILTLEQALSGFADKAVLAIAVLFIVAKGVEQSGGLEYVSGFLFSTKSSSKQRVSKSANSMVWVLMKFGVPVALLSAFLANIALVAMMIPAIVQFSAKVNIAPSKMLMPLSYAALLGGTLTLIGTGTNLIVLSMAAKGLPQFRMHLFEIGIIGLPVTVAGLLYMIAVSGKLLPDHHLAIQATSINAREYNAVLVVKPTSSLARKTVQQAGLVGQPGLNLIHIERGTATFQPEPDIVILPKDRLHFGVAIDAILSLTQLNGLALSEDEGQQQVDLNRLNVNQCLVEAVVANRSPMVHKRVGDLKLRSSYQAAIVAVHRHRTRLNSSIGDISLEAGDSLLMVADGSEFVSQHRNNSSFALVAKLPGFVPIQRSKAGIAAVIVLGMVIASSIGIELLTAALFSAAGLLLTKCLTPRDAMDSIDLPVLIMIAAAFGISVAMVQSGAANLIAEALMGLAGTSKSGLISCTYIATTVFSLAITNNAAVTIMFPVALAAAQTGNLDFHPFVYTLMMAASAGFMTPTGCPTNFMVYGPGGYKFADYMVYGGPMQLWLLFVTIGVTLTSHWWWLWSLALLALTVIATPIFARQPWNLPPTNRLVLEDEDVSIANIATPYNDEEQAKVPLIP
ncbi:hypothetical protein O6H91_20G069600 [Diphasiastrum complanatum]|uniref:Uncharacterized protein n=1 Tax=Diphasiastrum complanatum TaxID=34168 RepID=A0ACC2ARQ5_DIPCM|nr:hypothetical protein O6H91_20G069600 [Diphasiastrum complanatum]